MTRRQMETIARGAAMLAVSTLDVADRQDWTGGDPYQDCYEEYLNQLESGDDDYLKYWLGICIEEGIREAVDIKKLWLRAQLAA